MSIFPGFGSPTGGGPPSIFSHMKATRPTDPNILANTAALNLRNEQFVLGQKATADRNIVLDKQRQEDIATQAARDLSRNQRRANRAQNENVDFQQIVRPEASGASTSVRRGHGRSSRRVRRSR
jgi:hypothetical protein